METEIKSPPLQKEWEERKRLRKEGRKLREEGSKLWKEANKLREEGNKLWEKGREGNKLWYEAIEKHYGKDVKVTWRHWHKDNEPTCHVGSDVYV